jgi:hypothetical protein
MAVIVEDGIIMRIAKNLMNETMDGQFPIGLEPNTVFSVVRCALQSEYGMRLLHSETFGVWCINNADNIVAWSKELEEDF